MLRRVFLPKGEALAEIAVWVNLTFLVGVLAYAFRAWVNLTFWKDPLLGVLVGLMFPISIPLICLILVVPWVIAFFALRRSIAVKYPAPIGIFVLGMMIAIFLPLPTLPPLPEETHFASNRSDYEHVVEMARLSQLEHGNCRNQYAVPVEYSHLSETGCISIGRGQGLSVDFNPLSRFYWRVVYFQMPQDVEDSSACDNDGSVRKRIDEHWFVCLHEWN